MNTATSKLSVSSESCYYCYTHIDALQMIQNNNIRTLENGFEFSHNYTKLAVLSFLYYFVVKGKLISAKCFPQVGIEPATPTFHPNTYPSVLDSQVLIEGSLT